MVEFVKPLICFYDNSQFIFSEQYQLINCPVDLSVDLFLHRIEKEHAEAMKIVQINFEYNDDIVSWNKKSLYTSAKAHVFIVDHYELLSFSEIKKRFDLKSIQHKFKILIEKSEFIKHVAYIKNEIANGRIYQVNLTAPLVCETQDSELNVFFHYEKNFNSEYKAFLPMHHFTLMSFSPELFIQQRNQLLITRPIKGSSRSDQDFDQELYRNTKEEAELSMIVDLLRNDLNSLDVQYSAEVTKHRQQMQLGYIQHTYSEIQVRNVQSLSTVLQHLLPGGSISGCPKIESLKVIAEVEKYRRQAYTGTLGWWKGSDFCLSLSIRSFIQTTGQLIYHAGCGIVYDSDPESEWTEFLLKTGNLNVSS